MANFVRVKLAGWALNEILTSAQMNALDLDHVKAINGDDGSAHTGDVEFGDLKMNLDIEMGGSALGPGDNATIIQTPRVGTGADPVDHGLLLRAAPGRAQAGATDNNDGGQVELDPSRPGTGGSLDEGGPGVIIIPESGLVHTESGNVQLCAANFDVDGLTTETIRLPLSMHTGVNFGWIIAEMVCDDGLGISNYSRKAAFVFLASVSNETSHDLVVDNGAWSVTAPVLQFLKSGNDLELEIDEVSDADVTGTVFFRFIAHKH